MKKVFALLLSVLITNYIVAQTTIQMEKDGGVYKIPCTVNGVKMKFIFDTGAATVCISQSMAQFLYDGDYLSSDDIIGYGQSSVADGRLVNHTIINLKDIEIAGLHLNNVEASVIEGQNAPLLLGQSAIQKLGEISIDGDRLIIHNSESELTDEQIDLLNKKVEECLENDSYNAAIEYILQIENAVGLSENGLGLLAYCYSMIDDNKTILTCNRWLNKYENTGTDIYKESIYSFLGGAYYHIGDYSQAAKYYEKELPIIKTLLKEGSCNKEDEAWCECWLGECYLKLEKTFLAKEWFKKSIKTQCEYLHVSMEDIEQNKVKNKRLGLILQGYAFCYYQSESDFKRLYILSAKCGDENSIEWCNEHCSNWNSKSNNLFY